MTFIIIVVAIMVVVYLVLNFYPAFGGKISKERWRARNPSDHFAKGKFINQIPTSMEMSNQTKLSLLMEFIKGTPNGKPNQRIVTELLDPLLIRENKDTTVTWFGHSAILLQLNGKTLFIDPMLGRSPSPFTLFGGKRYSNELPINIEELPPIDAVLISHDHYDHLDYSSIKKLKDTVKQFFVPLGVGVHLERWGVNPEKIYEYDWWDEFKFEELTLASTPARHFSGRSVTDRDATLWCSWVIASQHTKIFFSGDSGYGPHFEKIGEKYGPFDLTLMECGQYDERWSDIHMMPEETVQAHLDVQGKVMIPIHWGAFTLALHGWTDPVERALQAAKERNVAISTPKIGETVYVGASNYPSSAWWK
jgi:L-ascorbate metabolism protein UlaG (beta-lactamase superfamily)